MEKKSLIIPERIFSVGEYIEAVNIALDKFAVKITGEVTQVKLASSGHVILRLKIKLLITHWIALFGNTIIKCAG